MAGLYVIGDATFDSLATGAILVVIITIFAPVSGAHFNPVVSLVMAIRGELGARDAVLLDGGISGQLLVREPGGGTRRWQGLRRVPLGLLVEPRR